MKSHRFEIAIAKIDECNTKDINTENYQDKMLIIKGCGNLPIHDSAYVAAVNLLKPFAKSIMYGEACSAVPVFKRK